MCVVCVVCVCVCVSAHRAEGLAPFETCVCVVCVCVCSVCSVCVCSVCVVCVCVCVCELFIVQSDDQQRIRRVL